MKVRPRTAFVLFCLFVLIYSVNLKLFSRVCADFCAFARRFFCRAAEVLQLFLWSAWVEQHVCPTLDFCMCACACVLGGIFEVVCSAVAPRMEKLWLRLHYRSPPPKHTHTHAHIHSGSRDDLPVPLQRYSASNFSFIQTRTAFPSSVFTLRKRRGERQRGAALSAALVFTAYEKYKNPLKRGKMKGKKQHYLASEAEINQQHLRENYNLTKKEMKSVKFLIGQKCVSAPAH